MLRNNMIMRLIMIGLLFCTIACLSNSTKGGTKAMDFAKLQEASSYPQKGPAIAGTVTRIIDGDTIDAKLANNETVRIRFALSNTPERSTMPGWLAATTFTKEKCPVGSPIIMDPDAKQALSYKRNVAKVFCLSEILQNKELVEEGLAVINMTRWCPITEFRAERWTGC